MNQKHPHLLRPIEVLHLLRRRYIQRVPEELVQNTDTWQALEASLQGANEPAGKRTQLVGAVGGIEIVVSFSGTEIIF